MLEQPLTTTGMSRRQWLAASAALAAASLLPVATVCARQTIRIGLTPVFLDDQVSFLTNWRDWFEQRLQQPVKFVQRGNYREIVDMVRQGKIDFAWICGYPYIRYQRELRLVGVPLWRGTPLYEAYLIAPVDDKRVSGIKDFRGQVFAYSDPDSNSGFLYPQYLVTQTGANPAQYFAKSFYTWSHRNVVEAVSVGLASGGSVDGYVWEVMNELGSPLTRGTRIIEKSPLMGYPPFVARGDMPNAEVERFRRVLMGMAADAQGAEFLGQLRLDGFVAGHPGLYDGIARMANRVRPT